MICVDQHHSSSSPAELHDALATCDDTQADAIRKRVGMSIELDRERGMSWTVENVNEGQQPGLRSRSRRGDCSQGPSTGRRGDPDTRIRRLFSREVQSDPERSLSERKLGHERLRQALGERCAPVRGSALHDPSGGLLGDTSHPLEMHTPTALRRGGTTEKEQSEHTARSDPARDLPIHHGCRLARMVDHSVAQYVLERSSGRDPPSGARGAGDYSAATRPSARSICSRSREAVFTRPMSHDFEARPTTCSIAFS